MASTPFQPPPPKYKTVTLNIFTMEVWKRKADKRKKYKVFKTIVIQRTLYICHLLAAASYLTSVTFLRKACGIL